MKTWKITAIQVGCIQCTRGDVLRYNGSRKPLRNAVWCVAATDGTHNVVIDTGIDENDLDWILQNAEPNYILPPEMYTRTALKKATGWEPEDVDTVINTHLHYDHCGSNRYFPNAVFYIQRTEFEHAFHPPATVSHLFAPRYFDKHAISYFKWHFLDGETEIFPGLICFPTPGHTHGHQSILIATEEGTVCIAGDVSSMTDNINYNIEPGITLDTQKTLDSLQAIRIRADFIIPGHESEIANHSTHGFPKILDKPLKL